MDLLRKLNYTRGGRPGAKRPAEAGNGHRRRGNDPSPAPETNGQGGGESVASAERDHRREHTHLALNKEDEKIRFRDIQQPREDISSPTRSGLEDEHVSYNAGYTNVHELIPWRTPSGRRRCIRITSDARLRRKPAGLSAADGHPRR
ncbi:hypothetical protein MJ585_17065 [Klebsiella pneumoniae]|nr:hypothetical protein MJ585_17065 [Klebsiella pneumoniae]